LANAEVGAQVGIKTVSKREEHVDEKEQALLIANRWPEEE
jgi:hypothetical protein